MSAAAAPSVRHRCRQRDDRQGQGRGPGQPRCTLTPWTHFHPPSRTCGSRRRISGSPGVGLSCFGRIPPDRLATTRGIALVRGLFKIFFHFEIHGSYHADAFMDETPDLTRGRSRARLDKSRVDLLKWRDAFRDSCHARLGERQTRRDPVGARDRVPPGGPRPARGDRDDRVPAPRPGDGMSRPSVRPSASPPRGKVPHRSGSDHSVPGPSHPRLARARSRRVASRRGADRRGVGGPGRDRTT